MATTYYVDLLDLSVADQWEHVRVGLVDSIPELADAYVEGCRRLVERGATGADQPNWYAVAKEEDGKERDLTSTEMGALAATVEQKFPEIKVRLPSPEGD
jgi:hypothetical protein